MGAGKSTVAAMIILGAATNRRLVEMDSEIEKREGLSVKEIFEKKLEPYFRAVEREVVKVLSNQHGLVVSCGGGVPINQDNVTDFKRNGVVIYLKASAGTIYERLKGDTSRPLLNVPNPLEAIKKLMMEREPFYQRADAIISTDGKNPKDIAHEILCLVEKIESGHSA